MCRALVRCRSFCHVSNNITKKLKEVNAATEDKLKIIEKKKQKTSSTAKVLGTSRSGDSLIIFPEDQTFIIHLSIAEHDGICVCLQTSKRTCVSRVSGMYVCAGRGRDPCKNSLH